MTQVTKTFGLLLALVLLLVGAAPVVGQEAAAQAGENPQAAVLRHMTEEAITRSVWRLAWLMTRKGSKGTTRSSTATSRISCHPPPHNPV